MTVLLQIWCIQAQTRSVLFASR